MSDSDQYLLLCDPLPEGTASTQNWRRAVQGVAGLINDPRQSSPWEMAEILTRITVERRLASDQFATKATAIMARAFPTSSGRNDLFNCVCAMSAAIRALKNRRVSAMPTVSRRDSIAVALWSALSFQKPLTEPRLEDLRAEILNSARRAGLELARRTRIRWKPANGESPDQENEALRWNASLDREEIEVLRWTLADESKLLERPYRGVGRAATVALARGLDLGLLLTRFPVFEHCELASWNVASGEEIDLGGLVDAVSEDRNALVAPFEGSSVIGACPTTFPLLTALRGGPRGQADGATGRSLVDWCGRALLESAIVRRSERNAEEN